MFYVLKKELKEVKSDIEVSYCEPEQGPLLGEDDEAEKGRPIETHMDQSQNFVLGLKDEMTWSHGDKQKRTLAYLDRCVAEKEGPIESLVNSVKNTDLLMEEMTVKSNETNRSYVFETDDLFVIAGFVADDRQSFETVLKFDQVKYYEDRLSNEERSEVMQKK